MVTQKKYCSAELNYFFDPSRSKQLNLLAIETKVDYLFLCVRMDGVPFIAAQPSRSMRGSRNFHERGSNENGNFWSQTRGGPTLKKSRNNLFIGKIFKFQGGGGSGPPVPPSGSAHALSRDLTRQSSEALPGGNNAPES